MLHYVFIVLTNFQSIIELMTIMVTKLRFYITITIFFKQLLFQYKGQGDYALKDAFLNAYPHFKTKYRRHLIALVPSSQQDDLRRGFNPNEMIVRSFSNHIFTGLYKNSAYKQTSQTDRSQVSQIIKIKDGQRLYNQNVIIFDRCYYLRQYYHDLCKSYQFLSAQNN